MLGECCLAPYAYGDALDVLCVRHEDASCRSTDWHVVFERLPRSGNNVVTVRLNGVAVDLGGVSMVVREVLQPAVFTRAVFTRGGTQERAGTPDVEAGGSFRKTGEAEEFAAPPGFELAALVASGALVAGRNEVVYDLGEGITAQAFVYLWHAHTPTVVFDVDGTVTVNDIVGHLGGFTDQPWVHAGICEFACALAARGYAVLFLTARPARGPTGIARTRRFLFEIAGAPRRRPRRPRRHAHTRRRPTARAAASRSRPRVGVQAADGPGLHDDAHVDAVGAARGARRRVASLQGEAARCDRRVLWRRRRTRDGRAVRRLRQQGQGRVRVRGGGDRAAPHLPHRPRLDHPDLPGVRAARPPAADAPGQAAAAGDSTAAGGRAASYSGLQPLAEVLFPPHCSEGERVQVAARFAAIAAQHLPNGFSKAASQKKLSSSAAPTPELAGAARQAAVEAV